MPKGRPNPVARSPLMRKGGVHRTAKSAKRFKDKQLLRKAIAKAWSGQHNGGDGPRFFCPQPFVVGILWPLSCVFVGPYRYL